MSGQRGILLALTLLLPLAGCASWFGGRANFHVPVGDSVRLQYASRHDLGISSEPFQLNIVYTIHPKIQLNLHQVGWVDASRPNFDSLAVFQALTQNVLSQSFRSAVEIDAGLHVRIEELKRSLHERGIPRFELPSLNSRALVLIDFLPSGGTSHKPAQLSIKMYDISYKRYEERMLFNPRLLIFEDFAEMTMPEDPGQLSGRLLAAWREVLGRMAASNRFQRFLKLGDEPLNESHLEGSLLLGIIPEERIPKLPDPKSHDWIESEILFSPVVLDVPKKEERGKAGYVPAPEGASSDTSPGGGKSPPEGTPDSNDPLQENSSPEPGSSSISTPAVKVEGRPGDPPRGGIQKEADPSSILPTGKPER